MNQHQYAQIPVGAVAACLVVCVAGMALFVAIPVAVVQILGMVAVVLSVAVTSAVCAGSQLLFLRDCE